MDRLVIVSGDGHIGAPVSEYRNYLDPKYLDLMPELEEAEKAHIGVSNVFAFLSDPERLKVVDENNRISTGGLEGGGNIERRLQELDADGIAAEVVYPGTMQALTPFFYQFNRPYPGDVRMAGARAYHRWLADAIEPAKGRLIGTADPGPSLDMAETLAELRYVADRGFRAVFVPGYVHDPALPELFDAHFEPFWAACSEMGLVLTIHAGYGIPQGEFTKLISAVEQLQQAQASSGHDGMGFEEIMTNVMSMMDEENPESIFSLDLRPRQVLWQLIFSGILDRYPNLKIVVTECRGDWVPGLKALLDQRFLAASNRPKLKMKPSEYFGRNIFITPSSPRRAEVESRREIGIDNFLFGADYPHPEGTWPNTLTWLRATCYDVPENELRAILGGNAARVYGLDEKRLSDIAARIGPVPSDILGHHEVDERVIADFEVRSNFSKSSPVFEQEMLDRQIDESIGASVR